MVRALLLWCETRVSAEPAGAFQVFFIAWNFVQHNYLYYWSCCVFNVDVNNFCVTFTGKPCFNGPVPILSITSNQTTIRGGEVITFECLFGGNYLRDTEALYYIYWTIVSPPQEVIHVDNGSNTAIGYLVTKPSQHCQDTNNYTCCRFVSDLHINTSEISVPDKTAINCNAIFLEINSGSNTSGLSKSLLCSVLKKISALNC